jgi:hypothetical protein
MTKQIAILILFFPLVSFCVAGIIELRSRRGLAAKLSSLVPIILGIGAFGVAWAPERLHVATFSSPIFGRWMALFSAVLASSSAFVSYSRRTSSVLVAIGGLSMAFIWMFFSQAVP